MTHPSEDQPSYVDPVTGQPLFIDPTTGQIVFTDASQYAAPAPTLPYPGFPVAPAEPSSPAPMAGPPLPADLALPAGPTDGYPPAGYTVPTPYGYGYPVMLAGPKNNSLATASMILSIVGGTLVFCYGLGAVAALVGAILGHVARKQIKERNEAGEGLATAGIVIGWIVVGLAVAFGIGIAILFGVLSNSSYSD